MRKSHIKHITAISEFLKMNTDMLHNANVARSMFSESLLLSCARKFEIVQHGVNSITLYNNTVVVSDFRGNYVWHLSRMIETAKSDIFPRPKTSNYLTRINAVKVL